VWFRLLLPGEKGISRCGSLATWYLHPNAGWTTDRRRYVFAPRYGPVGMSLLTIKQPEGTLVLRVAGPCARRFTFRQPLPPFDRRGMHVIVTWYEDVIELYLNGKLTETRRGDKVVYQPRRDSLGASCGVAADRPSAVDHGDSQLSASDLTVQLLGLATMMSHLDVIRATIWSSLLA
jgi:hypothetical protein